MYINIICINHDNFTSYFVFADLTWPICHSSLHTHLCKHVLIKCPPPKCTCKVEPVDRQNKQLPDHETEYHVKIKPDESIIQAQIPGQDIELRCTCNDEPGDCQHKQMPDQKTDYHVKRELDESIIHPQLRGQETECHVINVKSESNSIIHETRYTPEYVKCEADIIQPQMSGHTIKHIDTHSKIQHA